MEIEDEPKIDQVEDIINPEAAEKKKKKKKKKASKAIGELDNEADICAEIDKEEEAKVD